MQVRQILIHTQTRNNYISNWINVNVWLKCSRWIWNFFPFFGSRTTLFGLCTDTPLIVHFSFIKKLMCNRVCILFPETMWFYENKFPIETINFAFDPFPYTHTHTSTLTNTTTKNSRMYKHTTEYKIDENSLSDVFAKMLRYKTHRIIQNQQRKTINDKSFRR